MYSVLYQFSYGCIPKFKTFWRWWSWLIGPSQKKRFGSFALFHNKKFQTLHTPKQGLFKGFCDVSKIGDNPENNLAKFGYIPDMKAFFWKNRMLLYYWLPSGTYHKNLVILVLFCCFSKSCEFGPFSPWNHIFQVKHMGKFGQ